MTADNHSISIMREFPRKFLSLRDKNGTHRRSKSVEPAGKGRTRATESLLALFRTTAAKHDEKMEDDETDKEAAKIEDVKLRLASDNVDLAWTDDFDDYIRETLASKFAAGDVEKTVKFIDHQRKALSGAILPYNPKVQMLGAENRGNVTCYLDAMLFAMFANLDAYERMLRIDFADGPRQKLATLLRLWVNLLRSGELIFTDTTQLLQDTLAECGWKDAKLLEQQDTSEAFAFITEKLQLPLLSLQVDLFHQGKNDADDHKVVYERLLNLAVPPDPEGKGIKLEDCLEEYFNAQVDVFRDSNEEKKSNDRTTQSTIRLVTDDDNGAATGAASASPVQLSHTQPRRAGVQEDVDVEPPTSSPSRPSPRHRSTSVIQRIVLDDQGRPTSSDSPTLLQKAVQRGSTVVKAVTIPAWQFFRLIPWHSVSNTDPRNNKELAMSFDERPVVGICLKRYMMSASGVPQRHNTYIDIPDSLRLPHFMLADERRVEEDPSGFSAEYKLVLQSVVCHRGDSLYSGHYIAFARVAPKLLTDNRKHDVDPPPDYEEAQWVKFDDLHLESRVSYVDDIKQSLRDEMPYLLFYQIVPMVEVAYSTEGTETDPPSYNHSKADVDVIAASGLLSANQLGILHTVNGGYFESTSSIVSPKPPSIRFSAELERPSRISFGDDEQLGNSSVGNSRRQSVTFTDSAVGTPAITPEGQSPAQTPGEETTAQRLSRAAVARFTKGASRSRPPSQAGDGRISNTMSRLGLMRSSKEPLRDVPGLHPSTSAPPSIPDQKEDPSQTTALPADGEVTSGHRHKRRIGSRLADRREKNGLDAPPERECSVM